MFLELAELKSAIYAYQIDQISEADDDIPMMAIGAATDEVASYLRPNQKKEWRDGRPLYDVTAIFAATGTARNAMLLEVTKNIAVWNIVRLCNVDILFESTKDRYDRAINWLKMVAKGELTLDVPILPEPDPDTAREPFRFGSRCKFHHDY